MTETVGVTGATGHLGSKLCLDLLNNGFEVKALYYNQSPFINKDGLRWVKGDVLNKEEVNSFISGCDYVIHCAAMISIDGDKNGSVNLVNVEGTRNVADSCIQKNVKRLIHVSSTHAVMEGPQSSPFDETREYKQKQHFPYDYSKACGEQCVLDFVSKGLLDALIVRPSGILGVPDHQPSLLGKAIIDMYKGRVPLLPEGGYNYVDLSDVSASIVAALTKGRIGEVYLLAGKYYSMKEFSGLLEEVSGKKMPSKVVPSWFLLGLVPFVRFYSLLTGKPTSFTKESIVTLKLGHENMRIDKAAMALGHSPKPLKESFEELLDWFEKKKWI